jgi:hypothetical protein
MEWRPIDTAPKDGTEIILGSPNFVTCGKWDNSGFFELNVEFWESEAFGPPEQLNATHWMPLPHRPAK